jgi:hypothetical protein
MYQGQVLQTEIVIDPPIDKFLDSAKMISDAERVLTATMYECVTKIRNDAVDYTPHAFGLLRKSILPEVVAANGAIIGMVSTASPYGLPVETGSKPHWPPIEALIPWVNRKLAGRGSMIEASAKDTARISRRDFANALSRGKIAGRRAASAGDVKAKMVRQIAFLVARKISKVGTKGYHMFARAFKQNEQHTLDKFSEARVKIIDLWKSK